MANWIGNTSSASAAMQLFDAFADQFNQVFWNSTANCYLSGLQSEQCLPLWLGVVPQQNQAALVNDLTYRIHAPLYPLIVYTMFLTNRTLLLFIRLQLDSMVKDIITTHNVHLTTGIIGTKFLMLALSMFGRTDVGVSLAAQTTYPRSGVQCCMCRSA